MALSPHRFVPRKLRRRMITSLPPHGQVWLRDRLAAAALPEAVDINVAGGVSRRRPAVIRPDATPMQVRSRNLSLVTGLLEAGAIPYFCPPRSTYSSAVAVAVQHRDRVLKLLRTGLPPHVTVRPERVRRKPSSVTANMDLSPTQRTVVVYEATTSGRGGWLLGSRFACVVEFWVDGPNGFLIGANPDEPGNIVQASDPDVLVQETVLSPLVSRANPMVVRTRSGFARNHDNLVSFPVDAVLTWVDGADPDWLQRKNSALAATGQATLNMTAANDARFASKDELRYAMRSLVCNAPWIRQIFLVTDEQVPPWLNLNHPMVTVVPHRTIFGDVGRLPTFNSHAIESRLHHIPELSEHFLYLNDDMFLGRPLSPEKFFHANGMTKFFKSTAALDPAPPALTDNPATAAGKNNRRIIEERFGITISHKMRHVPYALRRSVLFEIEQAGRADLDATASHQFRHPADVSMTSSLAHYWAYATGRAVPSKLAYTYVDLGSTTARARLSSLLARRSSDVFCLNDTLDAPDDDDIRMVQDYLAAYFSYRAPFELSDEQTAHRARFTASQLLASHAHTVALPAQADQADPLQLAG